MIMKATIAWPKVTVSTVCSDPCVRQPLCPQIFITPYGRGLTRTTLPKVMLEDAPSNHGGGCQVKRRMRRR